MKNKIRIIIPYFGKFPNSIKPFLLSCKKNTEFEWLFFTDDVIDNCPLNVTMIKCSLEDIKSRIEQTVGFSIELNAPYKLCDFRPAFGDVFSDELEGYDFWGWGDIDLVYGDLSKFITDELLDNYDKIYPCGHLSLIKNDKEINQVYKLSIVNTLDYKEVFTNPTSFIFDEYKGLNEKLLSVGKKIYGSIEFADIDIVYSRFRTADKKTIKKVFPKYIFLKSVPRNYKQQVFCYRAGKTYRFYVKSRKVLSEEVVYIHYRHKIPCDDNIKDSFYITNIGFVKADGFPTKKIINDLNQYKGFSFERKEYLLFLKERLIMKVAKNKRLRNIIRMLKGKNRI